MARRGRIAGVENYSAGDLDALLEYIGEVLPTGASGWENVRQLYEGYAADNGRADRELVSLKKKFQGLLNCKKPTGDARCPESVREARAIQRRIEEKVHMQRDVDDGRTPSSDDGSHSPAPHTPRGPDEPEDEHGVEAGRRSPSDAEVRDTFFLSPPTPPPSNVSSNRWDYQGGMTSLETVPRFFPSVSGDAGLGFQHLLIPTPERSVNTSSVLQTPPLLPSLGTALFPSSPRASATRADGRHQEQEREQVPLRTNRPATPRVGNGGTVSHARTTHQTVERVREVAAPQSSGHGAPASSQRPSQATTSSVAASSSHNRRLSTSTNSTSATSNTTAATLNGGRSSQQPAASGKRKREPQNLLSTVRRELNEQSRYREIHASERFLQQQLDAEKVARRHEREERTALNNQVERLQRRNEETQQRFEAQKERLERQHEEAVARVKAKNADLKAKIEILQEKLADERDKSRGLENANAKLEIQLAGSRGFSKH